MSAMDLSHSELDMAILGQISACTNQREDVVVKSRHVATGTRTTATPTKGNLCAHACSHFSMS